MARRVLHAWADPSSRGVTTYEILLYDDGTMSCNCPGWINAKKGQPRTCTNVRGHAAEGARIFEDFKAGRPLPGTKVVAQPFPRRPPKRAAGDGLVDADLIGSLEL